jgi:hypothetical protein
MRIWGWATLIAALALGQAAEAQPSTVLPPTGQTKTLTTDSDGWAFPIDYGIPADGVTYRWDLWSDSAHPDAMIYLEGPNDVFGFGEVSNGDGTATPQFVAPTYRWDEIEAPGHTTILVQAQAPFSNCFPGTPYGVACALSASYVWADDVALKVDASDPVTITFSSVAIPEPATWLLMTAGVFGVGVALRQRRRTLRMAPPALA